MKLLPQKRNRKGQYRSKHKSLALHAFLLAATVWTVNVIDYRNIPEVKWVIEQTNGDFPTRLDVVSQIAPSFNETAQSTTDDGGEVAPSGVDAILKRVANQEGVDWKLLKAICMTESHCRPEAIGDGGDSWGAFQINKPAHPTLTIEQATDIEWSARWTAKHSKPYADNIALACKAHNGIGKTTNQWYVDRCINQYQNI